MNYSLLPLIWEKNHDALFPYKSNWNGLQLQLRLNDFPEEPMYSLMVNGEVCESFDEWPSQWKRQFHCASTFKKLIAEERE